MQIHELSRRRRADEGIMDIARGIGDAVGVTKGQAASAGILDKDAKLAAVRKNSDMKRVAAEFAAGWNKEAATLAKTAPAAGAAPLPVAEDTDAAPTSAEQDAADARVAASGASPEEVAKQRAAREQTIAARTSRTAPTVKTADPSVDPRLNPIANPRLNPTANPAINPTANPRLNPTANPAINPTANPAAATTTPTKPGAPPGFNAANVMKMPGMQPAGKKPAPATPTKPGTPPGFNAANVMKMPGMPGQPATPGAITPGATKPAPATTTPTKSGTPPGFNAANVMKMPGMPGQPTVPGAAKPAPATPAAAATPPAAPATAAPPKNTATAEYLKKFLAYVNQKTAIRDSTTYQMIGLNQILYQSGLRAELDKAKAEVLKAYEAGQDVTAAATDYILTAMAGAQLISSKNRAGVDQQLPDPVTAPDATTGGAPPGTTAAAPGAASGSLSKEDVQGLFKLNGVDSAMLTKLGTALQQASGTNTVNRTGNNTIDNMIRALGFKVK
jgi:hypothetical protein